MIIIGLTGGIASGKSTVANLFKELGAYVIDWDVLTREVERPHLKAWKGIVEYFGEEILNEDLTINRQKLGEIVFSNKRELEKLNQIVHPELFKVDGRLTKEIEETDPQALIIKDIPLLIEICAKKLVDKTVVVFASEENQLKRLVGKGMNQEEARKRIKAQLPLSEKVKAADFVIYNDGSLEETRRQVEKVFTELKKHRNSLNPFVHPESDSSGKESLDSSQSLP